MMGPFDQLSDPTVPPIPLVVHVPHCVTGIPPRYRNELVLSDDELARELLLMTDHYTDERAMSAVAMGGVVFRNRVSRLVMDPERFADDEKEEMVKRGMGAVYVRRHDGTPLRAPGYSAAQRASVMAELYTPYHSALEELVTRNVDEHGMCFLVDCHSFPSVALPYEDAGRARHKRPYLSKTRYISGLQCHLKLWCDCYQPELQSPARRGDRRAQGRHPEAQERVRVRGRLLRLRRRRAVCVQRSHRRRAGEARRGYRAHRRAAGAP